MKFCLGKPPINPINGKAQALPIINPFDKHGRVFFFSWLSFMLSFMAWYAFPPLLARTIRADLGLTRAEVLNSNIVALVAGLVMRFAVGPLCDLVGPRYVMVGLLWTAAIPCGLAGTIQNASGLYAIRFFLGIAGATFVPCQVWCTGFFDKNAVGTANAFAAGWGNAGGGITYFVMPAVFDSLVLDRGLSQGVAWRVSFVVPCILLIATGAGALLTTSDTPVGRWRDRDHVGGTFISDPTNPSSKEEEKKHANVSIQPASDDNEDLKQSQTPRIEVIQKPSLKVAAAALACPQTLMLAAPYFCSFGGELAINAILSSYYLHHIPSLGQTTAGQWAAMFGLMNVVTRPLGGFLGDVIYKAVGPAKGVHFKKYWYGFLVAMQGVFCLALGLWDPDTLPALVGLVAGIAVFMDAANGAAFALVPHINPHVNGIMSGTVGSVGNFGGVIFSIVFRYTSGSGNYATGIWVVGAVSLTVGIAMTLIPTIPKAQRLAGGYMSN